MATVSTTTGSTSYDVFLSFRGKDTRNNFIGFLNLVLKDRGINVLIDSEKLWSGEDIGLALSRAIEGSKILIPIFSQSYAHSKWCLMELTQIVHCYRLKGRMVLPIFFYVEPPHVRNQIGSFEEAFLEHEKNFESSIIESWREALKVVGSLKGVVLDETKNQAEQFESIAKLALGELINRTRLAECKYQIGMDSHTKDLLTLLKIDSYFVGICDFGSIGKTTIAKAVYNCILLTFNRHSFLSDVRERAKQYGIVSLQKQLLKDIFKTDFDIDDYHIGTKLIEQKLGIEKVLLVLDDVDSQEQVNALTGELNWFGQESRIIITTRDQHILNVAQVDKDQIYWPQELDHKQSLQLFSLCAFKRDQPPEDYMQLSHDMVEYSGGLPLTLEVLGSYLSDISDKEEWKTTLQKLKEVPPKKVQRRLKISYGNLENDYQKAIFLDATCFFIGWKKEIVISIWEACGYHPKPAIRRLIKRCLLKFEGDEDGEYSLRMHDQIRDMGREILFQMLKVLDLSRCRYLSTSPNFSWFPYLDRLDLGDCSSLDMLDESIGKLSQLKSLNLMECGRIKKLPQSIGNLKSLVKLDLLLTQVEELLDNICWLSYLKELILRECILLMKLPGSIGNLKSLVELHLCCCEIKELPDSVGLLEKLEVLDAKYCWKLVKLPKSMGRLKCSNSINLKGTRISILPDDFSMLSNLVELKMSGSLQSLSADLSNLKNLKNIELCGCEKLEYLPELPLSLVELSCIYCSSMVLLPDLSKLENLTKLWLKECEKLEEIPSLEEIKYLEELDAPRCYNLTYTPRKIHGQGTLLHEGLQRESYSLTVNDGIYNNGEPDQQEPNQHSSSMMVANFFKWSYVDDNGGVSSLKPGSKSWSQVLEEEQGILMRASNCKEACLDYNEDEAPGLSLILDLKPCEVKLYNGFELQQKLSQQQNIDDDVQWVPFDIEEAKKSNRTISFSGSSYGGVRGSDCVPEEVMEEEDEVAGSVKLYNGFDLQQELSQQQNIDDVLGFPFDIEEVKRSKRTINFSGSSYGGVTGSDYVPEEVMEEEDEAAGSGVYNCFVAVKAIWDCFCNCFTTGLL
ncbi:disease resistance protein RUN1-like [Macadamia integrifolia]|uniref:disease resistance protein RUN1-like n=1 Tax=Macadamia integrifolia TaxID=60698 RepID=UPI001C4F1225|nr:disease resistance protein RUN1-like [Macadamia integrifolia]